MIDGHFAHCSSLYPYTVCVKVSPDLLVKTQRPRCSKSNAEGFGWPLELTGLPSQTIFSFHAPPLGQLFCSEQISCQLILLSSTVTAVLNLPVLPFQVCLHFTIRPSKESNGAAVVENPP